MFRNHPRGLAHLFFIEMWERLAFYMLVGTLVLYASDVERGGLGWTEDEANRIYGIYLAMVYFTPFLGGMVADRLLGYRKSVLIGGLFFAAGLILLGLPGDSMFATGLVLLCCGNGLFKPNISAMVGNLYEQGDARRDVGFNIFYMGINIGSAIANLVAAPIRNEISWQWMFWSAAIGIGIGIAILLANWKLLERTDRPRERSPEDTTLGEIFGKILFPAVICGAAGWFLAKGIENFPVAPSYTAFLAGMLPVLAYFVRLPRKVKAEEAAGLSALLPVFLAGGTFFMILHLNGSALTTWATKRTDREVAWMPKVFTQEALPSYFDGVAPNAPRPHPDTLVAVDGLVAKMAGTKKFDEQRLQEASRLPGVRAVTLWTQAGPTKEAEGAPSSWTKLLAVFVYPDAQIRVVDEPDPKDPNKRVQDVKLLDGASPIRKVVFVREIEGKTVPVCLVTQPTIDRVYKNAGAARLPPGEFVSVVNPEIYQSWNPIWVVVLTPLVVMFFAGLVRRGRGISTPRKIFYGMLLTMASMLVMAVAGYVFQSTGVRVGGWWLVLAYFVITIGELCLSPMGLSLVTKLSPKRLTGLMMGGWFCATAFGNKLSGFLGEIQGKMEPSTFFLMLAAAALAVAMVLRLALPRLEETMKRYGA
jgi:POT family proton-dependent oligopeptide transporter